MNESEIEFRVSEEVLPLTQEYQYYTPPAGSTVEVREFIAEAAYDIEVNVSVIWDFQGEEESLWCILGRGSFNQKITIPPNVTDGIKKLALVLDNGSLSPIIISGAMTIIVRENE